MRVTVRVAKTNVQGTAWTVLQKSWRSRAKFNALYALTIRGMVLSLRTLFHYPNSLLTDSMAPGPTREKMMFQSSFGRLRTVIVFVKW